jgi:hypothetical protein
MNARRVVAATIAVVLVTMAAGVVPAAAGTSYHDEGCSPGYWKNHTDEWWENETTLIPTNRNFHSTFNVVMIKKVTLLEALQGGGGPGLAGAEKILARAATAAYLNAATEDDLLNYPYSRAELRSQVQAAWGDRGDMLELASHLDELNNLGASIC